MRKKLTSATWMIFIYLAIQLLPIPLVYLFPRNRQIEMSLTISLVLSLIASVLMIWINHRRKWTPPSPLTDKPSAPISKVLLWGVLGFIGSIALQIITANIEEWVFDIRPESVNTETLLELTSEYPLLIFSIILFAPIMEEFVFRKAIFIQLHLSRVSLFGAAVISSLIFALVHFDGHMLVYGTLGLWFSYLYVKTNNIYTPIIAHGLMNAFAALPLFYPEFFIQQVFPY